VYEAWDKRDEVEMHMTMCRLTDSSGRLTAPRPDRQGPPGVPEEGQIPNCSHSTLLLILRLLKNLSILKDLYKANYIKMSLQPPSLAMRSKSPSRGSTKAVILVNTAWDLYAMMYAHNARLEGLLEAPGSGLCLWNCPR
jgi:hypothetical protein